MEDSNSGYEFFKNVCEEHGIPCESAGGKTRLFGIIKKEAVPDTCIIADGAAIGPEMNRLHALAEQKKNIVLYLPESFEWILLQSGLFEEKDIRAILDSPEEYIESEKYFSWERFFTRLLIDKTDNTYLKYKKSRLNKSYLHDRNKKMILESIKGIKF